MLFLILLIKECFDKKSLKKCHLLSKGKITLVNTGPPAGSSGTKYSYVANGETYTGKINDKYYYFLKGKELPVIYSCKNPGYSKLLVEPEDFIEYGYIFPDSLYWVLEIIRK